MRKPGRLLDPVDDLAAERDLFLVFAGLGRGNSQSALLPRIRSGRKSCTYSLMIVVTVFVELELERHPVLDVVLVEGQEIVRLAVLPA